MSRIIIDGNAIYEVDEKCVKEKEKKEKQQRDEKGEEKHKRKERE